MLTAIGSGFIEWTVGSQLPYQWVPEISLDGGVTWFQDAPVFPPNHAADETGNIGLLARVAGWNVDGTQWSAYSNTVTVS